MQSYAKNPRPQNSARIHHFCFDAVGLLIKKGGFFGQKRNKLACLAEISYLCILNVLMLYLFVTYKFNDKIHN
jgi:hypothetical protein